MITKKEVAEVYSQNLVLTKGTEKWLPVTAKQLRKAIAKHCEADVVDEVFKTMKELTFQVNKRGDFRQILPLKAFRILSIEGGELEGIKFTVTKPTQTGNSQNFTQTFYTVITEGETRSENIVLNLLRKRNKLFYGTAGTDKPMRTEKVCPFTRADLWYPPMLAGIYVMQSAYKWCLTPKYGYHNMFRFWWNVGETILEQAEEVESRLPFKKIAAKLRYILENRAELAAACEPAEWELVMQDFDVNGW